MNTETNTPLPSNQLNDKEHFLLQSLAYGVTLQDIATAMGLSYSTVRNMLNEVSHRIEPDFIKEFGNRPGKTGALLWFIYVNAISLPEIYDQREFSKKLDEKTQTITL